MNGRRRAKSEGADVPAARNRDMAGICVGTGLRGAVSVGRVVPNAPQPSHNAISLERGCGGGVVSGRGGVGHTALPDAVDGGGVGHTALPVRKMLDHRGPIRVDVSAAWYFVTICAAGHQAWVAHDVVGGDHRAPRTFDEIATLILDEARFFHAHGKWFLSIMLIMPDHLHCIVHGAPGGRPLPLVIGDFKRYLNGHCGIAFQANFWDTRIRDAAHYAEKWDYIVNNPVARGLAATSGEWPHVLAFDRMTGEERS